MSFIKRLVAHCDICGHEWLTAITPTHCAKCKSRKWNGGVAQMVRAHDPSMPSVKERALGNREVAGSIPAPAIKIDIAALRAICARPTLGEKALPDVCTGQSPREQRLQAMAKEIADDEVQLCRKERWEDGQKAMCGKDKGHQLEHGMWIRVESI